MLKKITIQHNPLKFLKFEDEYAKGDVTQDTLLGFLCWPNTNHSIDAVMRR